MNEDMRAGLTAKVIKGFTAFHEDVVIKHVLVLNAAF